MTEQQKAELLSEIRSLANAIDATYERPRIDEHLKDLISVVKAGRRLISSETKE